MEKYDFEKPDLSKFFYKFCISRTTKIRSTKTSFAATFFNELILSAISVGCNPKKPFLSREHVGSTMIQ